MHIHYARIVVTLYILAAAGSGLAKGAADYRNKPDKWFAGDEAKTVAANILSWQSDLGGWPKNQDTAAAPYAGAHRDVDLKPTFDNGATTDELRFLARMYVATEDAKFKDSFLHGINYILKAQYPTGGWPQFYPPDNQYHRYITFNDDAMVRLMLFLREMYTSPTYEFVDADLKNSARGAFDRGVECILKCQIKIDGKPTVWCAQHDEKDYSPRIGRAYELPSLSGSESVGIVRLLMSLDNPSPQVIDAVQGAMAWFESAKLPGIKVVMQPDQNAPKGTNKVVVKDPNASPMWARFYDLATQKPIFVDRDGIPKPNLADIGYERRNGYNWLNYWPQPLLDKEYPAWKQKWAAKLRGNHG